jgi:GT2 family glycosyltransferase
MTPGDGPLASVIVVNYNGRHHLAECLCALAKQTLPAHQFEVILVDNGSTDSSVEFVQRHFPRVGVIALEKNVGFAAGNNIGLAHAAGRCIALLNNDTSANPRWLEAMLRTLDEFPDAGGVACKIRFHHDPATLNSAGLVLYRDGRGGDRGFRQTDCGQFDRPDEVFGPCGAAMMLRRELIADIGLFDEKLFMYYEDLDLAWRAHLRGWRFAYAPSAEIRHVHCGTSGEWSPFFRYYVERNRVLVNVKNASLILALIVLIGFPVRAGRAWWHVLHGRYNAAHGWAYVKAAVSLLNLLPHAVAERYRGRVARRAVPDCAFTHLMLPPPAKAA